MRITKSDGALVGAESRNVGLGEESGRPVALTDARAMVSSHPHVESVESKRCFTIKSQLKQRDN